MHLLRLYLQLDRGKMENDIISIIGKNNKYASISPGKNSIYRVLDVLKSHRVK